jgi:hypothetical protein
MIVEPGHLDRRDWAPAASIPGIASQDHCSRFHYISLDSQDTSVAQPHPSSAIALAQAVSGKSDAVHYIVQHMIDSQYIVCKLFVL